MQISPANHSEMQTVLQQQATTAVQQPLAFDAIARNDVPMEVFLVCSIA